MRWSTSTRCASRSTACAASPRGRPGSSTAGGGAGASLADAGPGTAAAARNGDILTERQCRHSTSLPISCGKVTQTPNCGCWPNRASCLPARPLAGSKAPGTSLSFHSSIKYWPLTQWISQCCLRKRSAPSSSVCCHDVATAAPATRSCGGQHPMADSCSSTSSPASSGPAGTWTAGCRCRNRACSVSSWPQVLLCSNSETVSARRRLSKAIRWQSCNT
mmetsp:Transcript_86306/g.279462  ORF Transcript_86306/g.279462 Transcript_86306/m.279462 type:complete len:219 (+) Transcript_86306:461-1117(+)